MPINIANANEKKLGQGAKGDVVVIHTSISYDGSIALVKNKDINSYFSEDNGWDEKDAGTVSSLKSGESHSAGGMRKNEVIIVKI